MSTLHRHLLLVAVSLLLATVAPVLRAQEGPEKPKTASPDNKSEQAIAAALDEFAMACVAGRGAADGRRASVEASKSVPGSRVPVGPPGNRRHRRAPRPARCSTEVTVPKLDTGRDRGPLGVLTFLTQSPGLPVDDRNLVASSAMPTCAWASSIRASSPEGSPRTRLRPSTSRRS